jgi:transposase-like protein
MSHRCPLHECAPQLFTVHQTGASPLGFLHKHVFDPILSSPVASDALKRGVRLTIMRMEQLNPRGIVQYYWSAIIGTERSTEFARQMRTEGFTRFEEVIDEFRHAGLRRAVGEVWVRAAVQRCCVHKLRNLECKAPKHVLDELRADFHRIVYAPSAEAARAAWTAFERTWGKPCPGVVKSLQEGGAELLTFFSFPKAQWKTLRTTNSIERLNEEFRRRVKT